MLHSQVRTAATVAAFGLRPGTASAHSPVPGIEGFYTGLLHPATAPGQLLVLAALGVLLAHGRARQTAAALATFAGAMVAGVAAGQIGTSAAWADLPLLLVAIAVATLAALRPGAGRVAIALSICGGLLVGLDSTPDPGPARPTAITLAGSLVGANLALLYISGAAGWLRDRATAAWVRIGLRVLAAWIAAIATLMAALAVATRDPPGATARLSQNHHAAVTEAERTRRSRDPS